MLIGFCLLKKCSFGQKVPDIKAFLCLEKRFFFIIFIIKWLIRFYWRAWLELYFFLCAFWLLHSSKKYDTLNIIGGGIQSKLLCQLTADVCGRKVVAGPVEATVMGNIALQLMALGEIKDIKEARKIIANSENVTVYEPQKDENWDEIYKNVKESLLC